MPCTPLRRIAVLSVALSLFAVGTAAAAEPGQRDASFSTDGLSATIPNKYGTAMAALADGGVVVGTFRDSDVGEGETFGSTSFRLDRFLPNGARDTTFGTGDSQEFQYSATGHSLPSIVDVAPDGDLVVAGPIYTDAGVRLGVMRLNPDGTFDSAFSGDGRATHKVFGTSYDLIDVFRTEVLDDGRIGLAVYAGNFRDDGRFLVKAQAILRLTPNLALDASFHGDGRRDLLVNDSDVSFLGDGTTYFGRPAGTRHELRRLTESGGIDTTFGTSGVASVACGTHLGALMKTTVSGKPQLACFRATSGGLDIVLYRLMSTGAVDGTYGTSGKGRMIFSVPSDGTATWSYDEQGRFWMARNATLRTVSTWRLDADGDMDTTFSGDGKASTTLPWNVLPFDLEVGPTRAFIALGRGTASTTIMALVA